MKKKEVVKKKIQKKKKVTKKKDNISSRPTAKLRTGYSTARDLLSWRKCGLGKAFVAKLCDELYTWGKKDDSTDLLDFYHSWGMAKSTFYGYIAKHDDLKVVHKVVMEMIGSRRQKLAMYKKHECDPKTIHQTLRLFHPDWRKVSDEDIEVKKDLKPDDNKANPTNLTVVMKSYEDEDSDAN